MSKRIILILLACWGIAAQAVTSADTAIWAATRLARSHQLQGLENFPRWEEMNLTFLDQSSRQIPPFQSVSTAAYEDLWWKHGDALPVGLRDSIQFDLGMLELLSQTMERADGELERLVNGNRLSSRAAGISYLHEVAVALEDANIIQDRLLYRLQGYSKRTIYSNASPEKQAQQYFSTGMLLARQILESVKTGRLQEVDKNASELRRWRVSASIRRRNWRDQVSVDQKMELEAIWVKWDRSFQRLEEAVTAWQAGDFPPASRHPHAGWTRNYQWYNQEMIALFGSRSESLTAHLLAFWEKSQVNLWPETGLFPAFRPLGLPDDSKQPKTAPDSWIFVVDVSGSMHGSGRLPLFRQSLAAWAAALPVHHQISLIAYSDSARILVQEQPASRFQDVLAESSQLSGQGANNVLEAMEAAESMARSSGNTCRIVLVTDGGMRYDEELIGLVERAAYDEIYLDAVFLPGNDARYGKSLKQLVEIGGGEMKPLTRDQHWLGLGKRVEGRRE